MIWQELQEKGMPGRVGMKKERKVRFRKEGTRSMEVVEPEAPGGRGGLGSGGQPARRPEV